jgi:hypothetical protein
MPVQNENYPDYSLTIPTLATFQLYHSVPLWHNIRKRQNL